MIRINFNKLPALAFLPITDLTKAYACIFNDSDQECDELMAYVEKTRVRQERIRDTYQDWKRAIRPVRPARLHLEFNLRFVF